MHVLLVLAHPVTDSFAAGVAMSVRRALDAGGHRVDMLDLYEENFDPRLGRRERERYLDPVYDTSGVTDLARRLQAADALILVFPQWWFNFPAILKGFFDRVFVPGIAFEHDAAKARIVRKLTNIRHLAVFTTTGSPWWMVRLYMGDPVRRLLKRGIAPFCARDVRFTMAPLHDMDRASDSRRKAHLANVERIVSRWR